MPSQRNDEEGEDGELPCLECGKEGKELRSELGLGGLRMEKSAENEGEGGLVMVIACCTEKGEPSMKSKSSSSKSVWRVSVGGDILVK
jgi:hypothetical protein